MLSETQNVKHVQISYYKGGFKSKAQGCCMRCNEMKRHDLYIKMFPVSEHLLAIDEGIM